jgi:hypothetical protein
MFSHRPSLCGSLEFPIRLLLVGLQAETSWSNHLTPIGGSFTFLRVAINCSTCSVKISKATVLGIEASKTSSNSTLQLSKFPKFATLELGGVWEDTAAEITSLVFHISAGHIGGGRIIVEKWTG